MRPSFENGKGNAKVNWARIWLDRYHQFLNQEKIPIEVDAPKEHVIAFLFALKQKGKLPWQRIQAVNAIEKWSGSKTGKSAAHLDWIVRQLRKLESLEVGGQDPQDEGDPGPISTTEHPIVQRLRAALRRHHDALSTEKAYVGWVKRFNSRFALDDNPECWYLQIAGRTILDGACGGWSSCSEYSKSSIFRISLRVSQCPST